MTAQPSPAFRFPRLVRVVWTHRNKRKSIAAVRPARTEKEAWLIAQNLEYCMVPQTARKIAYQTADLGKTPTARDALSEYTEWRTFFREGATLERVG